MNGLKSEWHGERSGYYSDSNNLQVSEPITRDFTNKTIKRQGMQ